MMLLRKDIVCASVEKLILFHYHILGLRRMHEFHNLLKYVQMPHNIVARLWECIVQVI